MNSLFFGGVEFEGGMSKEKVFFSRSFAFSSFSNTFFNFFSSSLLMCVFMGREESRLLIVMYVRTTTTVVVLQSK